MRPARVLIVDDSATMRAMLAATLASDPGIEVVGQAAGPHEAREAIKLLNPDVVTLDVEMPGMDGLSFLERIMRLRPTPVVMVSSMTADGASATIEALRLGAVDCVQKPTPEHPDTFTELPAKVRIAAKARLRGHQAAPMRARASGAVYTPGRKIVAIGASTGGVEALMTVLANYPENCPPTVITLHMPALFTRTFAQRLDKNCAAKVSEAKHDAPLNIGHVYLAPGGPAHLEVARGDIPRCRLRASDPVLGHRPSVDVLFHSVASAVRDQAVGVILTGMGGDGAEGLSAMRRAGARTIGQDEASCVVYGMPRVAEKLGAVERQLPLGKIGEAILALTVSK